MPSRCSSYPAPSVTAFDASTLARSPQSCSSSSICRSSVEKFSSIVLVEAFDLPLEFACRQFSQIGLRADAIGGRQVAVDTCRIEVRDVDAAVAGQRIAEARPARAGDLRLDEGLVGMAQVNVSANRSAGQRFPSLPTCRSRQRGHCHSTTAARGRHRHNHRHRRMQV